MADVGSKIRANDPQHNNNREAGGLERRDTGRFSVKEGRSCAPPASVHTCPGKYRMLIVSAIGSLANGGKLSNKLRNPTATTNKEGNGEAKREKEGMRNGEKQDRPAIDPLSQQILQRTNTGLTIPKLRVQNAEATGQSPTSPQDGRPDASDTNTREMNGGGNKADKK